MAINKLLSSPFIFLFKKSCKPKITQLYFTSEKRQQKRHLKTLYFHHESASFNVTKTQENNLLIIHKYIRAFDISV